MSNFLNAISTVITFLLNSLTQITNILINNVVFQLAAGIFLFSLVVYIISTFIHLKAGAKIDD